MPDKSSHGRGGIGNFAPDNTKYVDGEIVRAGPEGDQGDGPFSTGRGGSANIGAKGSPVIAAADKDVVPPQAMKIEKQESHHVGRGGAGNETHMHTHKHHDGTEHAGHGGLADKLKDKIMGHKQ